MWSASVYDCSGGDCVFRGWSLTAEYVDHGISGCKDSRPQLDGLMKDARARKLDVVIVARFDRFAQSSRHLILALEEFQSLGVDFIEAYAEGILNDRQRVSDHTSYAVSPLLTFSAPDKGRSPAGPESQR